MKGVWGPFFEKEKKNASRHAAQLKFRVARFIAQIFMVIVSSSSQFEISQVL